jgi:hypothetical protein
VAITTETRRQVRLATDALPNRPRALIDALYYHPCGSYADVARHTGIPIGSIGPTRLRTLRCLRRHITTESQHLQGPLGTCGGQLAYTRPNRDDPVGTTRKAAPHDRRDSARGKPGSAPRPR